MVTNIKIKVVTELRYDAIGIYNKALIKHLQNIGANVGVLQFSHSTHKNRYLNFIHEIINTVRLLVMVRQDDILLFTDTMSFNLITSIFFPNRKYALFHHYDKNPFFYKFLFIISYKRILTLLDGIIVISNFSLSQLKLLGVDSKKCKVIYEGIDHNLFKPSPVKQYSFDYILSIGSEEPRKNMKNIMKAFRILTKDFPRLKLLKVGSVSVKNRQQTMLYVEKYQLTKSVVFTGYIPEKQLPPIYSGAKLLLFPSLLEGFGLPVVEAMACGCPVVTSNRSPLTELVGSGQITINPLDPEEIARACQKIILDKQYRKTVITHGLTRAKYFDWQKTAQEVYSFITSEQSQ